MSDDKNTTAAAPDAFRIPRDSAWGNAWKYAAGMGGVGVVVAGAGYSVDPHHFAFSYLMAFIAVMTMMLGTMLFVLLQHLTGAGWSATVRRTAEFYVSGAVVIPILFVPVLLFTSTLFPWWGHHEEAGTAHAQEAPAQVADHGDHDHGGHGDHDHGGHGDHGNEGDHAAAHGSHGDHGPEHAMHAEILAKKAPFLNQGFFYIRMALYFLVWLWVSRRLFGYSTAQDKNGDLEYTRKLQRMAPVWTILWALTLTGGAVDWIMSLEPNWFSTMFGVRVFASSAVLSYALIILTALSFKRRGLIGEEINVEHFHDLGKLMFGFLVFWAYVSFSEFMLIWYASIPEETIYYHHRWDHETWRMISVTIVVLKFIVPFYMIMSRNVKRNLSFLAFGAGWLVTMHFVEMYYWIMPYVNETGTVATNRLWIDIGCLLATVGIYLAVVFRRMLNHPLIAIRDPRLARALDFINA